LKYGICIGSEEYLVNKSVSIKSSKQVSCIQFQGKLCNELPTHASGCLSPAGFKPILEWTYVQSPYVGITSNFKD